MKVPIDAGLCQGHGRCYDLAPDLFGEDEEGYGKVLGDGVVPAEIQDDARRAATAAVQRGGHNRKGRARKDSVLAVN